MRRKASSFDGQWGPGYYERAGRLVRRSWRARTTRFGREDSYKDKEVALSLRTTGAMQGSKLDEAALASWAWAGDAELGNCGPQMQELRPRARHHRPMAAP